jgi:hypothetical protein
VLPAGEAQDPCAATAFDVDGAATPRPKNRADYPATVEFGETLTADSVPYTGCTYTNPAAPSAGVGGEIFCGATSFQCVPYSQTVIPCADLDLLADRYPTSLFAGAQCAVSGPTSSVFTTTAVVTVATSVSTSIG